MKYLMQLLVRVMILTVLGIAVGLNSAVAQTPACSGADPGGNPAAQGLYAEYYSGYYSDVQAFFLNAGNRRLTRVDTAANYPNNDSFGDLIGAGVTTVGTATNPDQFSVRLRGSFYAATSTTYTFYLTSDDASVLWLDNDALAAPALVDQALINNSSGHAALTVQASVYLAAGFHNLLIHYGDSYGGNSCTLEFSTSAISRRFVPGKLLCSSVQPAVNVPQDLIYSPIEQTVLSGTASSSPTPVLTRASGDTAPVYYGLRNMPSGISIDASTGVLSVAAGTPIGTYTLSVNATTAGGSTFANVFTFSVVANPNTACSGIDGGGGPASNGLYAMYFPGYFNDSQNFFSAGTAGLIRVEPQLNFATTNGWGAITPPAAGSDTDPNSYSARYQGALLITTAGTYTVSLTSDDASYLWLDNFARRATLVTSEALINNGGTHAPNTVSVTIPNLTAGKHDLVVHYGDDTSGNVLLLEYSGPDTGGSTVVVPAAALCSSATTPPLPVVLTQFGAQTVASGVALTWRTAQELNSAYFTVERSATGEVFQEVVRTAGAGSTAIPQAYKAIDRAPLPGLAYYRLRLTDLDGTTAFSSVVAVTTPLKAGLPTLAAQVLPNPAPATAPVLLRVQQASAAPVQLTITTVQGQVLHREELPAAVTTELPLALPCLRSAGLYLVHLASAGGVVVQKLLVE